MTDTLQRALNKDANIAITALFAAMVAAWVYWFVFRKLPFGGPDSWALFGDYFGGVINPIVGIVTALLVVRTLHTTRQEAKDTRIKLEEQIALTERQIALSEMNKRLEGLYTEWQNLCSIATEAVQRANDPFRTTYKTTVLETLYSAHSLSILKESMADPSYAEHHGNTWKQRYHAHGELLREYSAYCIEHETVAKNSIIADYYRRRVQMPVRVLSVMGVLSEAEAFALMPASPLAGQEFGEGVLPSHPNGITSRSGTSPIRDPVGTEGR